MNLPARAALIVAATFALPGCTTIIVDENSSRDIVSVGVTRLVVPEHKGELLAIRRAGFGFGYGDIAGDAAWVGFQQGEWILADPSKCQMLIVIRSDPQAEHTSQILEKLEGEDVCYVKSSQP